LYSEEGLGGLRPRRRQPLLAVSNVTAHLSTASVLITALLYGGLLLCGFNVAIGLKYGSCMTHSSKHKLHNDL